MPDPHPLAWLDAHAAARRAAGLRRALRPRAADEPLLDLAGNDYLGLSTDPRVVEGAVAATRAWGAGSTGSRLVTGTTALHGELEAELAAFVGAPAALVFSSGYLANLGVVTALSGPGALVVSDAANHASLVDACRLARARVAVTPRDDPAAVDALLAARTEERALVVTDSVNSVDGAFAPLRELHAVCRARGALLVVDEAHGLGVVGPGGRGLLAERGLAGADDVVATVTLSKALGSQGGAVRRARRGDRAPGRHRPLVHLRHRPRPGLRRRRARRPAACCAPSRTGRPRSCAPPRPSRRPRACPRRRRPSCRSCWGSPTSPSPPRPRARERGRAGGLLPAAVGAEGHEQAPADRARRRSPTPSSPTPGRCSPRCCPDGGRPG